MLGISWLAEELLASQDVLCSVEWVSYPVWCYDILNVQHVNCHA